MNREEFYDRNYSFDDIEVDPRFIRCAKEMKITFLVWILFAVISIGVSYLLGRGDVQDYTYVAGLPLWWFMAILISLLFTALVIFITKFVFQDMDLTDEGSLNK